METLTHNKPLIFLTDGLSEAGIKFLVECEKQWFDGEEIDMQFLKKAFNNAGYKFGCPEAKDILEAWDYFKFIPKPILRDTFKNPVKLSTIFKVGKRIDESKILHTENYQYTFYGKLIDTINLDMIDNDIYFKLIRNNTRLYAEYNTIIGGRFIAIVENDLI